jgi:hypothetical protein
MAIENKEEVIQYIKSNEGFLQENNFITEKIVEKQAEYTLEGVESFINDNQGLRDKMYNSNVGKYLKKQLGVEEVTPEMLGEKIILGKELDKFKGTAKETALKLALKDAKHPELIIPQFDMTKIDFNETGITGIDEQVGTLKEKYPDLFGTKPIKPGTPPALPPGDGNKTEPTYEEFLRMNKKQKAKLSDETLKNILRSGK